MRWVLWSAVSSLPQVEKISLQSQIELGHEHAARHGGEVVAELIIPGQSRSIVLYEDAARHIDAYRQLKDLIDQRSFDVFCFLNRSRLGRKASLSMAVVELCHEAGIITYDMESPPATLDGPATTHSDMLVGAIQSVGAQQEVSQLLDRHRKGMLGRVQRGNMPAALPYGYVERYTPEGVRLIEIDEIAARWVRQIVEWYLGGAGTPEIAGRLNEAKVPAPRGGTWHHVQVRSILFRAQRYAGYSEINLHSLHNRPYLKAPGNWPPIIPEATAERIYAERDSRAINRRLADTPYVLSGLVWCIDCNRPMTIHTSVRTSGEQPRTELRCQKDKHPHRCMTYRRAIVGLREALAELDPATLPDDDEDRIESLHAHIAGHEAAIARLHSNLLRADDAFVSGAMDNDRYQRQVERINSQIEYEQAQIAELQTTIEDETARGTRRQRIEDVATRGLAMLDNPDTAIANSYLRQRVRIWIRQGQVAMVEYL